MSTGHCLFSNDLFFDQNLLGGFAGCDFDVKEPVYDTVFVSEEVLEQEQHERCIIWKDLPIVLRCL